ncbi:MAG: hypothetical protein HY824_13805 [Acidobacteria bacterium]|nr:hypothetical protein [Acidobacteriota bacterium]
MSIDGLLDRVAAGEALSASEVLELSAGHDLLALGTLADAARRRLHGSRVTYLRVAVCPFDDVRAGVVPAAAREIRLAGAPDSLGVALTAVERAKAVAGGRVVSGLSWADVARLAADAGVPPARALADLRAAGLEALAEIPIDAVADLAAVLGTLTAAGFGPLRLTVAAAPLAPRTALLLQVAELQRQSGAIRAIDPLPTSLDAFRPTTGYDDVKAVAVARLAAPNVASVQVDWLRHGPKLAQVALIFGADDVDGVPAADEAPEGRRRAPLEEVRRNIDAAGLTAVERDGRFQVVS